MDPASPRAPICARARLLNFFLPPPPDWSRCAAEAGCPSVGQVRRALGNRFQRSAEDVPRQRPIFNRTECPDALALCLCCSFLVQAHCTLCQIPLRLIALLSGCSVCAWRSEVLVAVSVYMFLFQVCTCVSDFIWLRLYVRLCEHTHEPARSPWQFWRGRFHTRAHEHAAAPWH